MYSQSECKREGLISDPVDNFVSNMWLDIHSTTTCKLIFLYFGYRPTMVFWYWTISRHVEKSQIWSSHVTAKNRFWYSCNWNWYHFVWWKHKNMPLCTGTGNIPIMIELFHVLDAISERGPQSLKATPPPTIMLSVLIIRPRPVRQSGPAPAMWYHTSDTTASHLWAGTILHWAASTWHWLIYILFMWRKHENMLPCTGSINASYKWIASCAEWLLRTRASESQATLSPAIISIVLITRPWPIHQKRIGTSHIVSYIRYNNEPTLIRDDSLLGCLHQALVKTEPLFTVRLINGRGSSVFQHNKIPILNFLICMKKMNLVSYWETKISKWVYKFVYESLKNRAVFFFYNQRGNLAIMPNAFYCNDILGVEYTP